MDTLLERINALAHKEKDKGLNQEEKAEQKKLREAYLKGFREQFRNTLLNTKVVDPKGQDVTPQKLKDAKKKRQENKN